MSKRSKKPNTPMPEGWADEPSDAIVRWYATKGYSESLQDHFENFCDAALSRGYEYVDWDSALRRAIRDDWARLRSNPRTGSSMAISAGNINRTSSVNRSPAQFTSKQVATERATFDMLADWASINGDFYHD